MEGERAAVGIGGSDCLVRFAGRRFRSRGGVSDLARDDSWNDLWACHFPPALLINTKTCFFGRVMRTFFASFIDFCFWYGFYFRPSARGRGLLA